jgi:hypothetical protein
VDGQIIAVYSLCEDVLKTLPHSEDPQCRMSDAGVMTTAMVAALYVGGNMERARMLLEQPTYIPRMLSKSRFNRRLHAVAGLMQKYRYSLRAPGSRLRFEYPGATGPAEPAIPLGG